MGFFQRPENQFEDKAELAEKGTTFSVTAISFDKEGGFENPDTHKRSDCWTCTLANFSDGRDDGTKITFESNPKRDEAMAPAARHIRDTKRAIHNLKLVKSGRAYYLEEVEGDASADLDDEIPF
jgi:hypothetical protein